MGYNAVTNDDLMEGFTVEQLQANIEAKQAKLYEYETGLVVLRNSPEPDNPYIKERLKFLEAECRDLRDAIATWQAFMMRAPSAKAGYHASSP